MFAKFEGSVRLQFLFRSIRAQFRLFRGLPALAGLILMALAGMAFASDTQKVDKPVAATVKPSADPTCKIPSAGESQKADPGMSSTDSSPAEEGEATPAEDSMKIKSDLADAPRSEEESAQESTKKESPDAADSLNQKAKTAAPIQCERPVAKKDLTLPASGKNGSPE
jgi:hypothetical protein